MQNILIKPLLTEKASLMNEEGVYGFVVASNANKIQIKQAVQEKFGVTVESVRSVNVAPRAKSRYTKSAVINGSVSGYKKAYVSLKEGDFIDIYDNEA